MDRITIPALLFLHAALGGTSVTNKIYWHPGDYIFSTDTAVMHALKTGGNKRHTEGLCGYNDYPNGLSFDLRSMDVDTGDDGNETVEYLGVEAMIDREPNIDRTEKQYMSKRDCRELSSSHPMRQDTGKNIISPPDAPCVKSITVNRKSLIESLQSMPDDGKNITIIVAGDDTLRIYSNEAFVGMGCFRDDGKIIEGWKEL